MKLTFIHAGQERTLAKHPAVQHDLRTGAVTEQVAASKPWYLRFATAGKTYSFKLPTAEREAIRAAKDILNGRLQRPDQFAAFLGAKDARRSITIGRLAGEWFAVGLPFRKTEDRTAACHPRTRVAVVEKQIHRDDQRLHRRGLCQPARTCLAFSRLGTCRRVQSVTVGRADGAD